MSHALRRLICWLGWMTAVSAHADTMLSPQPIALNCQTCHQQQPAGDHQLPELGKLSREQLRQSLLDFKYAGKPATIMPRLVKGYSDDELLAVADYLAPQ